MWPKSLYRCPNQPAIPPACPNHPKIINKNKKMKKGFFALFFGASEKFQIFEAPKSSMKIYVIPSS